MEGPLPTEVSGKGLMSMLHVTEAGGTPAPTETLVWRGASGVGAAGCGAGCAAMF